MEQDLLQNHIPLMVLTHSLLNLPLPALAINGYLLGEDSQKMSKSKGNVLDWQMLKEKGIVGTDLRFFIANLTDTTEASVTDPILIKSSGIVGKRHINRLEKSLEELHVSSKTTELLKEIRNIVRPWQSKSNSDRVMGLRRCTHLLYHEIKESLTKIDEGKDKEKIIISNLMKAYSPV